MGMLQGKLWSLERVAIVIMASFICAYPITGHTQTSNYFAGNAVDGQAINLNLGSIRQVSEYSLDFTYYLGPTSIYSQANCRGGYWVTFPERMTNRPQSLATQRMLNKVCSYLARSSASQGAAPGIAYVYTPPSNVRSSPNGGILCSVRSRQSINVFDKEGQWYTTDYCGGRGYIHEGQLKF